jgi:NAD-dependent dihydropyrimidine dehydrogenase PreA subunit
VNSVLKPYINPELCVGCGLCVHYCPKKVMFLDPIENLR